MAVRSKPASQSTGRLRGSAGSGATSGPPPRRRQVPSIPTASARAAVDRDRTSQSHGGERLLVVFVAATLIMVVAAALVGAVGQWWVLVPVMVVDLTLTFVVLASIVGMLGDDD